MRDCQQRQPEAQQGPFTLEGTKAATRILGALVGLLAEAWSEANQ